MKARFRRFVPDEETAQWLHRNALRIALAAIIAVGLLLFVPAVARCHRFNGADAALYIGVILRYVWGKST